MMYHEIPWTQTMEFPLLALIQFLPLAWAVVVYLLRRHPLIYPVGILGVGVEWLLTFLLYARYDETNPVMQLAEHGSVVGPLNYHAAADGVGVLFVLLTGFLSFLVALHGWIRPLKPEWRYLMLVCITESAIMSQFLTVDLLWYTSASAVELVAVGLLLKQWNTHPDSGYSFTRYMQFMSVGFLLLLAGVILLGWNHYESSGLLWSFDLFSLAQTAIKPEYQSIAFFLLFYGLAIRIPQFPLHGWLPITVQHGDVAVAPVFLLGLKTGLFGLVRFVFPLMHDSVVRWHGYVVTIAVVGIFYAAVLALMETDLRRLLAYAVISHTGILIVGLFSLGLPAFQGGVLLTINLGLAMAGLLFMADIVYSRTKTLILTELGGLFDHFPVIGSSFLIASLAVIGMPGTPGFDAVHLVLEAAIEQFGAVVTILAAIGNVAAAAFLLLAFQRAFLVQGEGKQMGREMAPVRIQERFLAVLLISVVLLTGFYSEPWFELINHSLRALGSLYGHGGV